MGYRTALVPSIGTGLSGLSSASRVSTAHRARRRRERGLSVGLAGTLGAINLSAARVHCPVRVLVAHGPSTCIRRSAESGIVQLIAPFSDAVAKLVKALARHVELLLCEQHCEPGLNDLCLHSQVEPLPLPERGEPFGCGGRGE